MTKSSVVSLNKSLEIIEAQTADIRLALMQRDIEMVCDDCWEVEIIDDCIAIYTELAVSSDGIDAEYQFGMLVGYFDECWWSGIVLFKSDDLSANTSNKLQSLNEIVNRIGIDAKLSSEHYVYVDSVGVIECEEFSEFMPKMLESIKKNQNLLSDLNHNVLMNLA